MGDWAIIVALIWFAFPPTAFLTVQGLLWVFFPKDRGAGPRLRDLWLDGD